jgi:hypothetical protein
MKSYEIKSEILNIWCSQLELKTNKRNPIDSVCNLN